MRARIRESAQMLLRPYLVDVYSPQQGLAPSTEATMNWSISSLERHAGKAIDFTELSPGLLNPWIAARLGKAAPKTVKRERADILGLWRHAADNRDMQGISPPDPRKIRPVKLIRTPPQGPTIEELGRVLAACRLVPGFMPGGAVRSQYFLGLFNSAWDTGLRRGDLFAFRMEWVDPSGVVALAMRKTGQPHVCRLRPETLQILLALGGDTPLHWPFTMGNFDYWVDKIKHWSGVGGRGIMQQIRRSAASYVERNVPGSATAFLGHLTPGLAQAHYLVPRIVTPTPPIPPRISKNP